MKDKNIVITGGNAGIGFETAKELARMGANVYIVGRDKTKVESAVQQIISETGNKSVKYFIANMSSQKSIRQLAEQIKKELPKVDVLINNAGGVFPKFQLSEDGLEMCIATNHFAYFLLTNLLLDLIKKSDYARIINVASGSHYRGKIDFESFTRDKGHFILTAYEQSKLANVLFTFELAERLKGTNVTVNCLHPGMVKTDIGIKDTQWYSKLFWTLISQIAGISVKDGAKTSIYLASSDKVKGVRGKYFDKCAIKEPVPLANDKNLQKQLWDFTEKHIVN
ncbi:MAG: hypothetical protein JWO06_294 [Bacteroidota bacterium]|nr:hypothetical protein [Bacteroidota bacterium]